MESQICEESFMESSMCHLKALNEELVADILRLLDGSTLAATACTCSDLRDAATDQSLWKQLCHSTWPSTSLPQAQHLISSTPIQGGFAKFYADSFPLILYNKALAHQKIQGPEVRTRVSPSDFTSLIDVYYKGKCVLSRVLDGIPEAVDVYDDDDPDVYDDRQRWFSSTPFKLELQGFNPHKSTANENEHTYNDDDGGDDDAKLGGDLCNKLAEEVSLSWVLLDKKKGKAVNLSSGNPVRVHKGWSCDGDYVMSFGCVVSVGERLLPHKLAECVIEVRCKLTERGECISWRQVSMSVMDMEGSHINGKKSLMVLNQTLYCSRSKRKDEVKNGYNQFKEQRMAMKRRLERNNSLADKIFGTVEILVFLAIFYACSALF